MRALKIALVMTALLILGTVTPIWLMVGIGLVALLGIWLYILFLMRRGRQEFKKLCDPYQLGEVEPWED